MDHRLDKRIWGIETMAYAGSRGDRSSPSQSLRWRVPALICALFVLALAVVLFASYREMKATLLQTGSDRAGNASSQISALFGRATQQTGDQLQRAAPAVRWYLTEPTAERLAAARGALTPLVAPPSVRRITVWNAAGEAMFEVVSDTSIAGWQIPPVTRPAPAGIGRLQAMDDHVFADSGSLVPGEPSAAGNAPTLGSITVRSTFNVSPPGALNRLVGSDARIQLGNRAGGAWTDFLHVVPAPAAELLAAGSGEARTATGERRVGALSTITGTPWAVWVDISRASLLAPAQTFLERMAALGIVVAALTVLMVRSITERLLTPMADMTVAAEAIAAGNYSQRVPDTRHDEIGRLGRAFNAMTLEVARAYGRLEQRVQERTRELDNALRTLSRQSQGREAYFASIVDSSDDAIIGEDINGIVTSWNDGAERLFGYTAREIVGTPIARIIPEDRQYEREHILGRITRGERVDHFETLRRARDGRLIETSVTASPIRDELGAVVGVSKIVRDVSAHKREQEARQASEGRYRTLFEYAPDGILIADGESVYLDANPSVCRMLGYSRQELVGLHASDIVAPPEIPHIESALHEIKARSDYHREWQFRRKDGSLFAAEVVATTMPDGNLLGMIRDVTERDQAVEAVRTAEERMRFALEAAGVGIWDVDYATGAVRWSEILEAQYGLQPGTFAGTFDAFVECMHPDDRESVLHTIGKAVKSGADFSTQNRSIWPDGTIRWLNGAGRILLDAEGKPLRGVGVSLDVTERRLLEEQFHQAQKMDAIGRLAGGVAHDFNNLLTVILGFCELLLPDFDAQGQHGSDITEIQKAAERAAELTRQLLAFSRKQIIEPTVLDLNVLVADMRPMLARLIGEDIRVFVSRGVNLAPVKADRGQVEQIVMNLAVNARDAMPKGGTLTIETANVELDERYQETHLNVIPGAYVGLIVTDTGTGMTPDVLARLFEPFFTTKEPGRGTGLGLATVHGIVARSGGSVGVYSEVGKGTSFKVYFPRADATEAAIETLAAARPLADGQTVLVVEDSEPLREAVRRLLLRQGYTVLVAANADEAVRLFETHLSIDVLLTDVVMPGANGPELTRRLLEQQPALRVVYMSGYTDEAIVHHGILEPGVIFLSKPFTSEALGRKIREALDHDPKAA